MSTALTVFFVVYKTLCDSEATERSGRRAKPSHETTTSGRVTGTLCHILTEHKPGIGWQRPYLIFTSK